MNAEHEQPGAQDAAGGHVPAWRSRGAWALMLGVALLGTAIDLATKWAAFRWIGPVPVVVDRAEVLERMRVDPHSINAVLPADRTVTVVKGWFDFTLVLNPGAVFGMGPGQRWFFITFTGVLLFGVLMFAYWTTARSRMAHIALGLLIAGAIGNLYDRLVFGCVRDFLHPLPGVAWPWGWKLLGSREVWPYVSNVADAFLLVGIPVLFVYLWRQDRRAQMAK